MPFNTKILGYARSKLELDEFKGKIRLFLKDSSNEKIEHFLSICDYVQGEYSSIEEGPPCFFGLNEVIEQLESCLLYTSPSPRDVEESRMPSSA